jgi:hypothetical protein
MRMRFRDRYAFPVETDSNQRAEPGVSPAPPEGTLNPIRRFIDGVARKYGGQSTPTQDLASMTPMERFQDGVDRKYGKGRYADATNHESFEVSMYGSEDPAETGKKGALIDDEEPTEMEQFLAGVDRKYGRKKSAA